MIPLAFAWMLLCKVKNERKNSQLQISTIVNAFCYQQNAFTIHHIDTFRFHFKIKYKDFDNFLWSPRTFTKFLLLISFIEIIKFCTPLRVLCSYWQSGTCMRYGTSLGGTYRLVHFFRCTKGNVKHSLPLLMSMRRYHCVHAFLKHWVS